MKPVLFYIGPVPINSYGVFLLLAFALGISISRRRGQALGIDPASMLDLGLYMIIGGLVVGRLGYVLMNYQSFVHAPRTIFAIWQDANAGMTFYGGLVGALLVAAFYARSQKLALARLLDVFAPALAWGYAVGMIGALLAGLYLGNPSGVPWALDYVRGANRHPTQLYLLVASLGTYLVLRSQERRGAPPGTLFFLWLLLFALARVAVEVFVESPPALGPFTLAQVVNLVAALVALLGLAVCARRPSSDTETAAPAPVLPPTQSE